MRRLFIAVALLAACAETPPQGFEDFFAATAAKDADRAWDRLSVETRAAMNDQAKAAGGAVSAKDALFGSGATMGLALTTSLSGVDVVEQNGDVAVVEVRDLLGGHERVTMKKQDGKWRLHLVKDP